MIKTKRFLIFIECEDSNLFAWLVQELRVSAQKCGYFLIIGSFWAKNFNLGNYFEPIVDLLHLPSNIRHR